MSSFGDLLRSQIEGAGFRSLRAFAESSGLSRETIRLYTTGERLPTPESLEVLVTTLRIRGTRAAKKLAAAVASEQLTTSAAVKHVTQLQAVSPTVLARQRQAVQLVDLFFEHSGRKRNQELEHYIRERVQRILEDE